MNPASPLSQADFAKLNGRLAEFHLAAFTSDPLHEITQLLREWIAGSMHLSFVTRGPGRVQLSSGLGADSRDFLMSTMPATASHPLIYRTNGNLAAISDVISSTDWKRRDMYHLARPFLRMEDSLGTDVPFAPGVIFSTCVIRERPGFHERDRQTFALLLPHFLTALKLTEDLREGSDWLQVFPMATTPRSRQELSGMLTQWLATLDLIPGRECEALGTRCGKWVQNQSDRQAVSTMTVRLPSFQHDLRGITFTLRCIPPSARQSGAVAIHVHPERLTGDGKVALGSLTPREQEVARWLGEGKTNSEIAIILDIRPGTVKRHLENIYAKLQVPNRTSAVLAMRSA